MSDLKNTEGSRGNRQYSEGDS